MARGMVCLLLLLLVQLNLFTIGNGCHEAQHAQPAPDEDELDISGRRRRAAPSDDFEEFDTKTTEDAKDADPELTKFFSDCMLRKTGKVFDNWQSVIEFILRDTYWFEATDVQYCKTRDSVACWQQRLDYLVKPDSELLEHGKNCIQEYDIKITVDNEVPNTPVLGTFFESVDYEAADVAKKRRKRFFGDLVGKAADILGSLDDELEIPPFTTPRTYVVGDKSTTISRSKPTPATKPTPPPPQCPKYSPFRYSMCITEKVVFEVAPLLIGRFPSLANFDLLSNRKFVNQHYSSCRIRSEETSEGVEYKESCPVSSNRKKRQIIPSVEVDWTTLNVNGIPLPDLTFRSCLIIVLSQIVKPSSPTFYPISSCANEQLHPQKSATTKKPSEETDKVCPCATRHTLFEAMFSTTPHPITIPKPTPRPYSNQSSTIRITAPSSASVATPITRPAIRKGPRVGLCEKGDHWTRWFNEDHPDSFGDMETLKKLQTQYRGLLCKIPKAIEARTKKGKRYDLSGDKVTVTPRDGLTCINAQQEDGKCQDYKVRFCCAYENPVCPSDDEWSPWYNRAKPTKKQDEDESLQHHVVEELVCSNPKAIQARLARTKGHYLKGNDVLDISADRGLYCNNTEQRFNRCKDYEVRFCCPSTYRIQFP